jgi:ribosomal protein S18 acetylase RimI-like enzyme
MNINDKTIPAGYQARPATKADLNTVLALRNASSQDTRGTNVTADHWQMRHWLESAINLATDSLLLLTEEGTAAAYSQLTTEFPYVTYNLTGVVHPDFRGQALGSFLVQWAEKRAGQTVAKAPAGSRVVLHASLFRSNLPGIALLQEHGFEQVRHFVHLRLEMDGPPPLPQWPAGISGRPLQATDWPRVGPALETAFQDHWGIIEYEGAEEEAEEEEAAEADPAIFNRDYFNSPGLCFVALEGDEVVGSCLCNAKTVEFAEAGYLGSLSVRRPWRRRGVGLALTYQALNALYQRGTRTVLTDTDGDSFTQAYDLYQKVGMIIYRQENVYEKEIRPGRDLIKRQMETTWAGATTLTLNAVK